MYKIAVVVGSLRQESLNLKFAKALEELGRSRFAFDYVEIGNLPIYNEDLWQNPPAAVLRLKRAVESADAVLFVTPEFNRSIPAALKNAIEWGSRPYGQNSWGGKPASIVGTSPGVIGTAAAQTQLRSIAVHLDMIVLGQPEVYFVSKPGLINENRETTDDTTREFLEGYLARFEAFIEQVAKREPQRRQRAA
jgi:chromate reductase, NAD(P)H dehydrogenase (quinone)